MASSLTSEQTRLVGDIARELDAADPCAGERGVIVKRLAAALGVSVNTAYRYLKQYAGWTSGKKPRRGKGETCVPESLCRKIAELMLFPRANGKQVMTLKLAVHIAKESGEGIADPETGEIIMPSVETISRAMRRYGCHPEQLKKGKPTGRVRSLHPNHTWLLDASVCILYRIRGTKRVMFLDERSYNAKKPKNLVEIGNRRIVRYVVVDHTSNAFYVRYEQAAGETAEGVLRTLTEFMADRGHRDPAHGLPRILYTDPGPANTASLIANFCNQLGIRLLHHAPGAANATGAVEVLQDIIEKQFESRLRFMDVPDVAFLQGEADRWRRHFCARAEHSRLKTTRNAAWLTIREEQLRTVPRDVLEAIAQWKEVRRNVGTDFVISVDTHTSYGVQSYNLRELGFHGLNAKESVRVLLNPFKAPEIIVVMDMPDGTEKRFNIAPVEKDEYGQDISAPVFGEGFKTMPKTRTEKVLEEIKMRAYGVESAEEADRLHRAGKRPSSVTNIMADVKEAPLYLGRTGQPAKVAAPAAEPMPMSRIAFAVMMKREHPDVWNDANASACMEWLAFRYPDSVPGSEIENVIAKMREKFGPRQAAVLRLAPAGEERSAICAG
ncbi:DDE-type integrase/transposase/recombinase [Desulfovibrio piger]|nr:DDE-type integrase/transposase/recombinase [Desulfovibrio piger]